MDNNHIAMPIKAAYFHDDGGRSQSKRKRQTNDCTVRAIAIAMGRDYDEVYDALAARGRRSGRKFKVDVYLEEIGLKKTTFPAQAGQRRYHVDDFIRDHQNGTYIVKVAKHVFAVIDGVMHDTSMARSSKTVYAAWQIGSAA